MSLSWGRDPHLRDEGASVGWASRGWCSSTRSSCFYSLWELPLALFLEAGVTCPPLGPQSLGHGPCGLVKRPLLRIQSRWGGGWGLCSQGSTGEQPRAGARSRAVLLACKELPCGLDHGEGGRHSFEWGSHTYGSEPQQERLQAWSWSTRPDLPLPACLAANVAWALGPCVPALVLATVGLSRPRALTFSFPARFTSSAAPPPAPLRSWRRAPRHAALGLRVSLGWDTVGAGGFILTSAGLFWLLGNQGLETRLYAPPPLPRTATSLHPPQQSCRAPEPRELSRARGLRGLLQAGASAEDHRYQGCGLTLRPWPPVLPGDARPPCRQETGSFSSARCDHKGPGGGDCLEGPRSALQGFKPLLSGRVPQEH